MLFRSMEDEGLSEKPVYISDSETEFANLSSVHPKQLVITRIDLESEEEEEETTKRNNLKKPPKHNLLQFLLFLLLISAYWPCQI